ncbi:MAG: transketolase family protein [Candidatus Micrarchaeota archaeon]|nr:transketolase family protein [Candidatus Micrarchaeota archaeon]
MRLNPKMHLLDPLSPDLKKAATREGFGAAVAEIGDKDPNVVALSSDVAGSVQLHHFIKKHPGRFFNVGVAEQNLASVAAGLAYAGKTPFIGAFAAFSPGRNWEQIRTTICYGEANVKIGGSHTGLDVGEDGATHQMLEDIALMRSLPGMLVLSPCDYLEAKKATEAAWKTKGPAYIRCTRGKLPIFTTEETPFEVGKINLLVEGEDIAIVATGDTVFPSILAAAELEKEGISAAVANMHTLSHPDEQMLAKLAQRCGTIVTVEDHQVKGGLGGAVCETLAEASPARVRRHGMLMKFGESGPGAEVMRKYGLDPKGIANLVRQELGAWKKEG